MTGTFTEILAALIVLAISGFFIWRTARHTGEIDATIKAEREKIREFLEQKNAEIEARDIASGAKEAGARGDDPGVSTSDRMSDATFRAIFGRDRRPGE